MYWYTCSVKTYWLESVSETPSRGVSADTGKKSDDVSLKKKDAEIANLQDSLKDMEEKVIGVFF